MSSDLAPDRDELPGLACGIARKGIEVVDIDEHGQFGSQRICDDKVSAREYVRRECKVRRRAGVGIPSDGNAKVVETFRPNGGEFAGGNRDSPTAGRR